MTIATPADPTEASIVRPRFIGERGAYWRLMIRGAVLQAITLGIYRFWLFTDMRRFLWSHSEVDGDTLEYSGTAMELLLGFLMAIGILIPIYALLFVATYADAGLLSQLSGVIAFFGLAGFGQYAAFRARRYRLTRTVFRGIRCHQTGSAARYALRAMLWWALILVTLGLAYPFAQANLERYKLRHTFYGDLGARFAQSGWRLFFRGLTMWLVVVAPLVASIVIGVALMDWNQLGNALASGNTDSINVLLQNNQNAAMAVSVVTVGFSWSFTIALVLFPVFQAMMLRWWISGLRIGEAAVGCKLRTRDVYGAYLRYLLYALLMGVVLSVVAIAGFMILAVTVDFNTPSTPRDVAVGGGTLTIYVAAALAVSTIYQVVVKMRLWQLAVDSMAISGFAAVESAKAGGAAASAVGEGLADALGSGGI